MLKNKLIIKKIRNICILLMAIIIMIGVYTNVRRSRAENVIQIELEVSDRSEALESQKITVDATETQDGNYLLDLPTSVNGNMVTKYYLSDGSEVDMYDENADKTLTLTEVEVTDQKMQLQTDYDKKEITTEDGQVITLYNKELLAEKKTEENAEGTEGTINKTPEDEATSNTSEETTNETTNETTDETTETPELDDSVIVTGYMPLDAQVDIQEIDTATLTDIVLPSDTQTIQKAYEVSVYQTVRNTIDAEGNIIATEIVTPENMKEENNATENTTTDNATADNTTEESTISENTILEDGTHVEEEKVEYDPSIYDEQLTIKTKNTEENTIATVYSIQEDNQVQALDTTVEDEYTDATFPKDKQTVKYILATEPDVSQNADANDTQDDGTSTMALTDGNMLMSTSTETASESPFLGNTAIRRRIIENVTFVSSTSGANDTAWDVSAEQNGSILAWYEVSNRNGASIYKVYIGSNETIYANTNSSYLFCNLGNDFRCETPELITNIELLNTSQVTNMEGMFSSAGMFIEPPCLDLGDNFDTSNVTNMRDMFNNVGLNNDDFTLDLGDKFDTSNVTDMTNMFRNADTLISINLGSAFTNIAANNTDMFYNTGVSGQIVITVPEQIYQDSTHVKLNENSSTTIEFTRGTFKAIRSNYLRTTNTETQSTSGFLGNTSIQRQNIDNVTFVSSTAGANDTAWDVSEAQDGSIMAWYTTNSNGTYKVYIGSDETIYANPDSSYLFAWIGYSTNCTATETITNIELLNVSNVIDMSHMFYFAGYSAMTSLDLGDKFDTSKVIDMSEMFRGTG